MASDHHRRVAVPDGRAPGSAPAEVTITRLVGRGVVLVVLAAGQLVSGAWMLGIGLTGGSQLLTRTALIGYAASTAAAWWIAARRPGQALVVMAAGCAALFGLLLVVV
jgi:hypothetical protein